MKGGELLGLAAMSTSPSSEDDEEEDEREEIKKEDEGSQITVSFSHNLLRCSLSKLWGDIAMLHIFIRWC